MISSNRREQLKLNWVFEMAVKFISCVQWFVLALQSWTMFGLGFILLWAKRVNFHLPINGLFLCHLMKQSWNYRHKMSSLATRITIIITIQPFSRTRWLPCFCCNYRHQTTPLTLPLIGHSTNFRPFTLPLIFSNSHRTNSNKITYRLRVSARDKI